MKLYYYLLFSQLGSILFELNKTTKKKKPRIRDDSKDGGKRLALDQALEKRQKDRSIDSTARSTDPKFSQTIQWTDSPFREPVTLCGLAQHRDVFVEDKRKERTINARH